MSTAAIADEDLIPVEIDDGLYVSEGNVSEGNVAATRKVRAFRIPSEAVRPEQRKAEALEIVLDDSDPSSA